MKKILYRVTNWLLGGQLERLVDALGGSDNE